MHPCPDSGPELANETTRATTTALTVTRTPPTIHRSRGARRVRAAIACPWPGGSGNSEPRTAKGEGLGRYDRPAHLELDLGVGDQRDSPRVLRPELAVDVRGDRAV